MLLVTGVYEEAIEPDLEALRVPKARKLSPGEQEGLLDCVFCPVDIPQDAVRDCVAAVAVQVDELGERIFVPLSCSLDQRCPH